MDNLKRTFDAIPSKLNPEKDFPVLMEAGNIFPLKYKPKEIEDVLNKVRYDQLGSGSCVGQALAKAKSISEYLQSKNIYQFSGWWAWMNRPRNLSFLLDTDGANLKDQAEKVVDDGIVYLSQYDLNPDKKSGYISYKQHKEEFYKNVRPRFLNSARVNKADKYVFPKLNEEIKKAIQQFGCVCIGLPIYGSFYYVKSDGIIPLPNKEKEPFMGFHAMLIYGWDSEKGVWYGDNSYGDDWGNKGFFTIDIHYPIAEYVALVDDTRLSWADKYFYYLWKKGITLHERNFDHEITRGEVMAILARFIAGGEKNIPVGNDTEHWAKKYFTYLNSHGVKVFDERYEDFVSRGEFMTLLYRAINADDSTDVLTPEKEKHWAEVYFKALTRSGIAIYDMRFDDRITRGEVMALISRALGYQE